MTKRISKGEIMMPPPVVSAHYLILNEGKKNECPDLMHNKKAGGSLKQKRFSWLFLIKIMWSNTNHNRIERMKEFLDLRTRGDISEWYVRSQQMPWLNFYPTTILRSWLKLVEQDVVCVEPLMPYFHHELGSFTKNIRELFLFFYILYIRAHVCMLSSTNWWL